MQDRARIRQIHIIKNVARIDAQRNAVTLRRGVTAESSRPAATKRIRAASAPSATAAPPSTAATPAAARAALIFRPKIKRLRQAHVQREMVRPRKVIYWNRFDIHTRLRIESAEARNSYDRTNVRTGRKRGPLVQLRTSNQILAQCHIVRRARTGNHKRTESQSPLQPHGTAQKEAITNVERRPSIVLHKIRRVRRKAVRTRSVAVRIIQHVIGKQSHLLPRLNPALHEQLILPENCP